MTMTMNKVRLRLGKSMTINTGNFQSIKPSIEIEVETNIDKLNEVSNTLTELIEKRFQIEVAELYAEQMNIDSKTIKKYTMDTFKNSDNLLNDINNLEKELCNEVSGA